MNTNDGDWAANAALTMRAVNAILPVKYEFGSANTRLKNMDIWISESSMEFDTTERRDAQSNASVHVLEPFCRNFQFVGMGIDVPWWVLKCERAVKFVCKVVDTGRVLFRWCS